MPAAIIDRLFAFFLLATKKCICSIIAISSLIKLHIFTASFPQSVRVVALFFADLTSGFRFLVLQKCVHAHLS